MKKKYTLGNFIKNTILESTSKLLIVIYLILIITKNCLFPIWWQIFTKYFIKELETQVVTRNLFILNILSSVSFFIVYSLEKFLHDKIRLEMEHFLRMKVINSILNKHYEFVKSNLIGSIIENNNIIVEKTILVINEYLKRLIIPLLSSIGFIFVLFLYGEIKILNKLILSWFIISIIIFPFVIKIVSKYTIVNARLNNILKGKFSDLIKNLELVVFFLKKDQETERIKRVSEEYFNTSTNMSRIMRVFSQGNHIIYYILRSLILMYFAYFSQSFLKGDVVSNYLFYILVLNFLHNSVENFGDFWYLEDDVTKLKTAISFIFGDEKYCLNYDDGLDLDIKGDISFENVTFKYPYVNKEDNFVIKNFNLNIKAGEKIAILGKTGTGKSTLIQMLINKIYKPSEGRITIDGLDIQDISTRSLLSNIAYLPQNTKTFCNSIAYNIAYGDENFNLKDNLDMTKVEEVAKIVELHDYIMSTHDKYNTELKENSGGLSGGQAQCLSIARTIMRKKYKILILDEFSSSLDRQKEEYILNMIQKICKNNITLITITHRLEVIKCVDRIIIIKDTENKTIVKEYSPEDFAKNPELFLEVYNDTDEK